MAWYNTTANAVDTVISTRVRLARNINGYPFASLLDAAGANEIIEKVGASLEASGFRKINFSDLSSLMATSYVERHYVSPEFATLDSPHALLLQEPGHLVQTEAVGIGLEHRNDAGAAGPIPAPAQVGD